MTSHRTISLIPTLLAVLIGAAPSSAFANPLLSGYGGPGAGNQAILGSTLVGGSGGGGGSAGGTSGGSPGASPSETIGPGAQSPQSNGAPTGSKGSRAAGQGAGSRGGSDQASGAAARAYPFASARNTSQATSGATETLGISGEDVAYIFLALGGLAFTGVLTRRLARTESL
jgi:hypothetical protein